MTHLKAKCGAMLVGLSIMILPAGTAQAEPSTTRINIRGIVPTICRVEFSQAAVATGEDRVDLGQMTQLCNNIEGYRVIVQHPAGLSGAHFSVDGVEAPLSSGTETVLVDSNDPAYRTSGVSLHLASASAELSALSFRIEPKGATY